MSLSSVILGMSPRRYYRANETSGSTIDDSGSDNADLTTIGGPTLGSTQLVASDASPAGSFSADGVDDTAQVASGSNVGGGAANTFPAFTIMCVCQPQNGIAVNTFWCCEGSSAANNPILGFAVDNGGTGRYVVFYRNGAGSVNSIVPAAGTDLRIAGDSSPRLLMATVDPAGSGTAVNPNGDVVFYIDSVEVARVAHIGTGASGTTFNQYALTNLWRTTSGNFAKIKIEHAASWDRALTSTERASVYSAYTAAGGGGVSVTATGGAASAAGGTDGFSETLTAGGGAASAGGGVDAPAFTYGASGGSATAGGGTVTVNILTVLALTAAGGAASASGGAASLAFSYGATGGTATANGGNATAARPAVFVREVYDADGGFVRVSSGGDRFTRVSADGPGFTRV